MSDDLLRDAALALRESSESGDECARLTRARVLRTVRDGSVRRRKLSTYLLPVAAVLAVSSAWAAVTGRVPAMVQEVRRAVGLSESEFPAAPPPPTPPRARAALVAPPAPTPETQPAAEPETEPVPPSVEPAPAEPKNEPRAVASAKAAPAPDPSFALYRAAHTAHFVRHDPAAALQAWDAYLRAAPRGRFSLEARYNRALCLTRLGRKSEAKAALEPFARGDFGSYRREEAKELVDALSE